jgi:serine/threonine protein kinase
LKPENILIAPNNHLKLIDFGDSKMHNYSDDDGQTKDSFVGSPYYVSPEMLDHNMSSHGVDIWSLGVLAYKMIVGKEPFMDDVENELYNKIIKDELDFSSVPNIEP